MGQGHEAEARADFERALRGASMHGLVAALTRRPNGLLSYQEARRGLAIEGESYRGVRVVPIDRIVGSLDRTEDFDRAFRPRRANAAARWQRVARAHHEGRDLPPVRLYQVGDAYFVEDGHHRVSVARALGQGFVDAEVVEVRARAAAPAAARAETGRGWQRLLGLGTAPGALAAPNGQLHGCAA